MAPWVGLGRNECCDCYKGRLRPTRDAVVAIGLAKHHKCGLLWKRG